MKHIKRKTLLELNIPYDAINQLPIQGDIKDALKNLKYKDVKDKHAILLMDTGETLRSFFVNDNGKACSIPLANPVLIYFNFSQTLLKNLDLKKATLLNVFTGENQVNEDALKLFYEYFGLASSFATMLMTSIEAFVNQKLDSSAIYTKSEGNKFQKVYDYNQIQRWIPLTEKIEHILDSQQSKSFKKSYPLKQIHIDNLKAIRDLIVHTKAGQNHDAYVELFRKTLSFNFYDTIQAVKDFINFYDENLVESCPCGIDS
ncbi:MAG: hypothetical protein ABI675_31110 [Chitinophagaceae bacterium]